MRVQEYDPEEPSGPPSQEGALAALHGIPSAGAGLFLSATQGLRPQTQCCIDFSQRKMKECPACKCHVGVSCKDCSSSSSEVESWSTDFYPSGRCFFQAQPLPLAITGDLRNVASVKMSQGGHRDIHATTMASHAQGDLDSARRHGLRALHFLGAPLPSGLPEQAHFLGCGLSLVRILCFVARQLHARFKPC